MKLGLRVFAGARLTRSRIASPARSPSRVRSARSALGFGSLAFLSATVVLSAAVETIKPAWRDPEYGHRLARLQQAQRESPTRPLVLVLGTSRTQNAIRPAAMGFPDEPGSPRAFNFGQTGASVLKLKLTLDRVLDAGVRPTAVIVEVLPVSLMSDAQAEKLWGAKADQLSAGDLRHLTPYATDTRVLPAKWAAARAVPWHVQRTLLVSHWLPRWQTWKQRVDFLWTNLDPDGFSPFPNADPPPAVRAVAKAEYAVAPARIVPSPGAVRVLGDLVARCRAEGIAVAVFVPPVSPMFRGWFSPGVLEAGDSRLASLTRDLGIPLFAAPDDLAESEFADGHHLLPAGADRYSRRLADTHLKPWLTGRGGEP